MLLKDFYAKKGGRDFDIIGVCLDNDAAAAKQYLAQNRFPWKHLHEPGGLDGRLANEMGVMTLPLMMLVDQNGNVANNNIHVAELEAELAGLLRPAARRRTRRDHATAVIVVTAKSLGSARTHRDCRLTAVDALPTRPSGDFADRTMPWPG